jgi:hypothetical protein
MELMDFFKKTGSQGGKKSAAGLSKAQRVERARKAAQTRWKKAKTAKAKPKGKA